MALSDTARFSSCSQLLTLKEDKNVPRSIMWNIAM